MTAVSDADALGETDPLDVRLRDLSPARVDSNWSSRRLALGLSPTPRPTLLLLIVGMALGPHGLGILSASVLISLDPAVAVALATLGVLVGLDLVMRRHEGRLLAAGSLESAVTTAIVAGGLMIVYPPARQTPTPWLFALMLGVCAAPSSTAVDASAGHRSLLATRIGDLDDVLPILLGVIAVGWTRPEPLPMLIGLVVQGGLIAVAISLAAWLLITQTRSESEQRVFLIGALLLLGGAAAHVGLSALCAGLLAGLSWGVAGGTVRDHLERDIRYMQHPLIVLLLVVAGARWDVSDGIATLVVAYVVLRISGKFLGGWCAALVSRELPRDVGLSWSSPGVVGIAIALNLLQTGVEPSATIFGVVVAGSLVSDATSLVLGRAQGIPR